MHKQKLIDNAVESFKKEWKILQEERKLLSGREDLCFQRFLERCKDIHEMTFFERKEYWEEYYDKDTSKGC